MFFRGFRLEISAFFDVGLKKRELYFLPPLDEILTLVIIPKLNIMLLAIAGKL